MKNFTNNFKQFTSRLSARWLIMALMLLVGTSSAWGAKTTLKQGETITFIFSQGDVPQNYGWNSTQLHIWDDSGNDETFDFNEQHVLVAGDWIPTNFQFFSKYEHSGWRGQTSDIGDCGGKTKLQPNTTYSVKLAGKDETDWIKNQWDTSNPNKQFKITLHCFADCTPTVSDKITIKCSSDENVVYAWVWGASTNANYNNNGWPGDQITDTDSDGVLDLTISTTENLNIIFSNGSSQTGNILGLQVGKEYTYSYKGTDYTLENIVCIEPSCTPPSAPSITINLGSICSGDYATITAGTVDGAISYSLYKGNNDAPAQTNNTGIFEVSEAASYRVTVTTCGESNKSSFVTLSEKPGPTASNYVIKDASKSKEYTGSEQTLTAEDITVNNNAGAVVSVYFKQDGNIVDPINVGDYEVYVTTAATDDICAGDVMIGTFTITCPTPEEAPTYSVTQQTTSCDGTDNKLGIITLNYNDAYTYKLNDNAVTITDNKITGLAAGSYTISAAKTCGSAQSLPISGESVTITSTDLTPTIDGDIVISGNNNICSGETTELTCNVEASKGIIESYSWNPAGTIDGNTLTTAILNETTNYVATVTITNDGCPKGFSSAPYEVTVNPVPSLTNVGNVTLCSSSTPISVAELIAETNATASNSATIGLYAENGDEIEGDIDINVNTQTTTTYKLKASTQTCSSDFVSFTLTVNPLPAAPSLTSPAPVCEGTTVNLPTGYNWYNAETGGTEVQNTAIKVTGTYWAAALQNECESATRTRYDVTVNPKPSIGSITQNVALPVPFEDVVLTANDVTSGATVKWYEAGLEKATGLTYVVTSETATSKAVTAKAFLNGCESDEASHPVRFSAEDCGNIGSNNSIIITCDPGTYTGDLYCYIFGATTPKGWSDCKGTKTNGIWKWEFNNINEGDHSLIFHSNSKSNGKDCKTGDLDHKLQRGYQYDYALNGVNSNWCNEPHPTIDPVSGKKLQTITDPAVKTVSVETEPGEGNIIFEGQVVKTGCAETLTYGFAYSTDANADKSTWTKIQCTNVGNTVGTQFSGSKTELEDDTYYVCAYITNSEGTTYGTVTEVSVSTVKTPIRDVTLDYCNEDGEDIDDPNPMCKGAIAYVKLSYVGSKYSDIKWLIEGVETNLVTDEGDGVWSYEIQGDGSLSVELKNDENKDPAWPYSNKLPFTTIPEPIAPTISLDKSTLCSNDDEGATISLANTVVGQTYSLFKEIENGDDTQIGNDIECTEQNKESISFNLKGLDVAGRYYVIAKENVCNRTIGTTSVTLEVVNTTGLSISIEPNTAVVTPWEPVKLKITATEGYQYNVTGLDGMVYTVNGDTYTVKIPLPEDGTSLDTDGNVIFENIGYNISATLITGGDNQCIDPATCTITLTPYLEPCTQN